MCSKEAYVLDKNFKKLMEDVKHVFDSKLMNIDVTNYNLFVPRLGLYS